MVSTGQGVNEVWLRDCVGPSRLRTPWKSCLYSLMGSIRIRSLGSRASREADDREEEAVHIEVLKHALNRVAVDTEGDAGHAQIQAAADDVVSSQGVCAGRRHLAGVGAVALGHSPAHTQVAGLRRHEGLHVVYHHLKGGICEPQACGHVRDKAHGLSVFYLWNAHPLNIALLSHLHLLLLEKPEEEREGREKITERSTKTKA
ncbi:hypothetical protein EYF80_023130 [Liparis tanakae]|uniref:Uncharacterized protein n=1 Tax=Liparis tanakae TaxID=230148 RepID=A0A4Z2HLA1_9TELE|nr:hypothetical protein EYF80_023130 [Liparis tanakae]